MTQATRLWPLLTATHRYDKSLSTYRRGQGEIIEAPILAYLVETKQGRILYDVGCDHRKISDPALRALYPFARDTLDDGAAFALYEASYALLYYPAWEFAFRGVLLFGLAGLAGGGPAALAAAILVQTMLSTVYHLGHPPSEVLSAFAFGIVFGAIAALTGSVLYPLYLHALVGVLDDVLIRRSLRRTGRRA